VQPSEPASNHPVDQLIRRLVHDPTLVATPDDVAAIVERIATAPFNQRPVRVPGADRGLEYRGIVIGRVADPLMLHLAKRVRQEEEWSDGTTADEYLADLRAAVRHPRAHVLVYERTGDCIAATITPTIEVVSTSRCGRRWHPHLLVVYSATFSNLRTGYMYSDMSKLDMPEALRWLR
jgi:hypothetical protein